MLVWCQAIKTAGETWLLYRNKFPKQSSLKTSQLFLLTLLCNVRFVARVILLDGKNREQNDLVIRLQDDRFTLRL